MTSVEKSAGSSVYFNPFNDPLKFAEGAGTVSSDANQLPGGAARYNSYVDIGDEHITFESENTGSGPFVQSYSSSEVKIGVHNPTGESATFGSTITAAGLGFYLADVGDTGACLPTGCAQIGASSIYTFSDLSSGFEGHPVAQVGFNFSVKREGDSGTLYSLSGHLDLSADGDSNYVIDTLSSYAESSDGVIDVGPRGVLNGFAEATGFDGVTGVGYAWDATDFSFDIGAAEDQVLVYSTEVYSLSGSPCIDGTTICLIAYSGFGDPVGRGGGVSAFARVASFGDFGTFDAQSPPRITGLNFSAQTFDIPTFENGVLTFQGASGAVPEPATWLTMILGFGLLGTALRRRRTLAIS